MTFDVKRFASLGTATGSNENSQSSTTRNLKSVWINLLPVPGTKSNSQTFEKIVNQQQELIDYLTSGKDANGERTVPEDSYFLEEKVELEEQRKLLISQKQDFDKVRDSHGCVELIAGKSAPGDSQSGTYCQR